MTLKYLITIPLLFSLNFAKDKVFKYYHNESPITIDDITIDLNKVLKGVSAKKIDTVFIKLSPLAGHDQNIFWDHDNDVKDGNLLNRLFSRSNKKSMINIKGRSAKKFKNPIRLKEDRNVLAFPLRSRKRISGKDKIILSGTHFQSTGAGRSELLASIDRKSWKKVGYEMVFSSKEKLESKGARVFFAGADELDTVYCKYEIKLPDKVYIDKEFPIGITFPRGTNATWGDLKKVQISVNGSSNNGKFTLVGTGTDSLRLTPSLPIISSQTIQLSNVPLIKGRGTDEVSITLSAKISDPSGSSNFHRVWHDIPTNAGNKLTWKSAKAITNLENKYFYKDVPRFEGSFTIFLEGEGFEELEPGDNIQFRMMSGSVHWLNDKVPVGKNFNFTFSKDKTTLICTRDGSDWAPFENRGVRIGNLNFYTDNDFTGESPIEWFSAALDQGKKQLIKNNIVIARPLMYLNDDNYIFSNDQVPSIEKLVLKEDDNFPILKRGDILIYELSDKNLHFNKQKKDRIKIDPPYLSPIMSGGDHQIRFRVEKESERGEVITINNIPLLPIRLSAKIDEKITGSFKIKSPQLLNKSEDEILDTGSSSIHISKVQFTMERSIEYIKDQNRTIQTGELPEIRVRNAGTSDIFREKTIKLFIETEGSKESNSSYLNRNGITLSIGTNSNVKAQVSQNETFLEILLKEGIPAGQYLSIQGATVQLAEQFDEVSLAMVIESGQKTLSWKTPQVLVFSSPYFQSTENQALWPARKSRELFSTYIDMRHLDDSFQELSGVSILLPEFVPLQWSSDQKNISINGPGKSFLESTVSTSSDRKMVTIKKKRNIDPNPDSLFFSIAGLKHDKLVFRGDAKSFNLQISLDGGRTICAIDPYQKRIVSDKNLASIYADKITTAYFPFKKGKINGVDKYIALEIDPQNGSTSVQWDVDRTNIRSSDEYSSGYIRSFNFKDPIVSPDKSKMSFHIQHDKYDQGVNVGLIGFNDEMTIRNIFVTNDNVSLDDICLTLLTPYGEKKYYRSKDLVTFEKRNIGEKEIEVTIGLKNLRKDLADPKLRDWYWTPDNNFALLNKTKYKENRQKKNLKIVERILFDHYEKYKAQVEYDWIFWWYLSWVKVRADELDTPLTQLQRRLKNSDFRSDFKKSKQLGFYGRREPGLDYDYEEERRKEFENAYTLFLEAMESKNNAMLFRVEDEVFSSLSKRGMTNYIRAANYSLLGQIGDHFNDNTPYKISTRRATKTTTYPERILYRAKREISQPADRKMLKDWEKYGSNRIELIDGYKELGIGDWESASSVTARSDIIPMPIDRKRTPEYASKAHYTIRLKWYPEEVSEKFDWRFDLKSPKVKTITRGNDKETMIIVGKQVKETHAFGQDLTLYGGGEYELKFSPKRTMIKYAFFSIIGGSLAYAWTL